MNKFGSLPYCVRLTSLACLTQTAFAVPPRDAKPVFDAPSPVGWTVQGDTLVSQAAVAQLDGGRSANFRLHLEYTTPSPVVWLDENKIALPAGETEWLSADVTCEHPAGQPPRFSVSIDGRIIREGSLDPRTGDHPVPRLNMGADFTVVARFQTSGNGTLFSKCAPEGPWVPDAKALFIRDGRLVYDIGWLGSLNTSVRVNDGAPHSALLTVHGGEASIWLDGRKIGGKSHFTRPDAPGHVFKIGTAAPDFAFDFAGGEIAGARCWQRALGPDEIALVFAGKGNTPDSEWIPSPRGTALTLRATTGARIRNAWLQPLEAADHAALVGSWDAASLERGKQIYSTLCVICHGTVDAPGSLPTALRFGEGTFKNGSDPHSMWITLTKGFGQMVPQPQFTTAQKYDVIHYVREAFVKPHNPSQYTAVTPTVLTALPKGLRVTLPEKIDTHPPQYELMDFGPALFWTYQVADDNFAYKGIAIRLDDGPGGVSKGHAWMVYDHDTLRVAAATTGEFVDWKGIAFDGSHQTHTSLAGDRVFVNPVGPGWENPAAPTWDDPRLRGRDGKPYGPLPREWAHYEGLYLSGNKAVVVATVGGTRVLDSPGLIPNGVAPIFTRTLNVDPSPRPLRLRVCPDSLAVAVRGDGTLAREAGFIFLTLSPNARARLFFSKADQATIDALARGDTTSLDLDPLTHGGPPRWSGAVTTKIVRSPSDGSFAVDTLTVPDAGLNPWQSWMRLGGFDFFPDGHSAAVCTWNGDVWRVDGIDQAGGPDGSAALTWRRLATGLFQPLGVKIVDGIIHVCCRDQIARLRDLNGDGEIDFIENFNNDHQVTEHFHEFAMGLQTDAAGNFYYAKSARHALPAVVPQHGTLLRVSPDGRRTDIIATGFRAANGVCVNDDGTFFVTDQEGHWTPKNRINLVTADGGFYGNMFGYTDVTDASDAAMRQPLCWITNAMDRSPAELLWVPKKAWGPLGGSLLNLSYGTGRIFVVPHETVAGQIQGGVCEFPLPPFPTGVMRGRFHPVTGDLFACGLFAWAGNQTQPGGLYRLHATGRPMHLPTALHARKDGIELTFTDPIDPASITPGAFALKTWTLRRSADYGSNHYNERPLAVTAARAAADGRSVFLSLPNLQPAQCMEIIWHLKSPTGDNIEGTIHNTIHNTGE